MKRRRLVLLGIAVPSSMTPGDSVPTDEGRLNRFAETYNAYISALRMGVVDLKAWARVKRAWESLTR